VAVGDFKCPKCGAQMELGHMRIVSPRGFSLCFKPLNFPWEKPVEKLEEKEKESRYGDRLFGATFSNYESDAHRCPKCRLLLLDY